METGDWIIVIMGLLIVWTILLVLMHKRGERKGAEAFFNDLMGQAFEDRVNRFEMLREPMKPVELLLIGDSLIQEYPHDELFKEATVLNRGIGGDTTHGVFQRLDASLGHHTPKHIALLIGTNDLGFDHASRHRIVATIATIAETLMKKAPEATLHVLSLLPVNASVDASTVGVRTNDTIDAINDCLKTHKTGYAFHDVNRFFKDEDNRLKAALTRDGLHISVEGYRILTDYIEKNILQP